jgi:protein involved in polysaccharide export with SLBB domain
MRQTLTLIFSRDVVNTTKSKEIRSRNVPNSRIRGRQALIVSFVALLFVWSEGHLAGQTASDAGDQQQPSSVSQPAEQGACYFGAAEQTPGASEYNSQMPAGANYGSEAEEPSGAYSQPGDYSQQGYSYQQGDYAQQGVSNYSPGQPQPQYPTDQQEMGQAPGQSSMPAEQIIAILQQAPDAMATVKALAGQQSGVDPSTITDDGIYNCIRQNPNFRSQVATGLISQGYLANPQPTTGTGAPAEGTNPVNRGAVPKYPYPYSARPYQPRQPSPAELPSEVRRLTPVPYPNLPSLRDLYSQEIPANQRLKRFGSDAFLFGTGNVNQLPIDLPVGPDYVLGPGDGLVVNMWGGQSARLSRTIDPQGQIELPEAGTITISGLTISQAQSTIQQSLGKQFQDEHVEISLGRVRTVRVYVVGDVQRPGAYDVSSLSTPLNALYAAGGPTSRGSLRTLKQLRGNQVVRDIDLYDFLLHGVHSDIDRLLPGDTIQVPPVGAQVSVAGMVRRPAIYELKGKADLSDVLNLAGGVLVSADLTEIRVERVIAHERRTMLRVQISDGSKDLPPFEVQDGDFIEVSPILPYNEQVVYLEGHVFEPGQRAWREGMTVNDLLRSYQDVMPEPATHAEIVRLVPPDLHPVTIPFDLPDVLVGNDPITLQPFDTVRIFGRYEIDAPRVSIEGPVLRPGEYPMSQGMTAAELVRAAGGFRRSAYREEADLSSYEIQNGQRVLIQHSVIAIGKALDGDKSADVALQPGDVVGIRQISGWNDIGASITIRGEVTYAGTYGIEDGERLSSVLKRAGGFRSDAYPEGAVFERVQVRELEENNRQEMIHRVESTVPNVSQGVNGTSQDRLSQLQAMQQQQQQVLAALRNHPSTGRLVIRISGDISKWENTPADIVVRAGDTLAVPKRPDFVLVTGQVYNATGITYRPGKDAGWYLRQAGGATRYGDKKEIFILRADGSVVGNVRDTVFEGGILGIRMLPGDSIIVPEKVIGGSQIWRDVIGTAQIASSVALTGAVAGVF